MHTPTRSVADHAFVESEGFEFEDITHFLLKPQTQLTQIMYQFLLYIASFQHYHILT